MKKLALTNLIVSLLSTRVFACTLAAGANPNLLADRQNEVLMLLGTSLLLVSATSFLYFKKGKKGIVLIIVSLLIFGYAFLTGNTYVGDCGDTALYNARMSVLLTFICFSLQFFTWFFRRKSHAELT